MNTTPYWKAAMISRYHKFEEHDRFNLHGFYLAMDEVSQRLFQSYAYPPDCTKSDKIQDGDFLDFPLSNGGGVRLTFFHEGTEFALLNGNGTKQVLVSQTACRTDNVQKEHAAISFVETAFNKTNTDAVKVGLGSKVPDALFSTIMFLQPGSVIQFSRNKAYVCQANKDGRISLVPVYEGSLRDFSPQKLKPYTDRAITFTLSDYVDTMNKMQEFYLQNKRKDIYSIDSVVLPYSTLTKAFDGLYAGTRSATKKIILGPYEFLLRKDEKAKVSWYIKRDQSLVSTDEETVRFLYGFLATRPDELSCIRDKVDIRDEVQDSIFKASLDPLIAEKQYSAAFEEMCRYVQENRQTLQLKYTGYVNDGGNLIATAFVFKYIDGQCQVYSASFEENDFSKSLRELRRCKKEDFVAFCERDRTAVAQILIPTIKKEHKNDKQNCSKNDMIQELSQLLTDNIRARTEIRIGSTEIDSIIDQFEGR